MPETLMRLPVIIIFKGQLDPRAILLVLKARGGCIATAGLRAG